MARDKVTYEWHIECADEHGDIHNIDFADTFAEAQRSQAMWASDDEYDAVNIALCRSEGNEDDGIGDRYYAYVRGGVLERQFSTFHETLDEPSNDGPDVPQRFLKEVVAARPFAPERIAA